MNILRTNTLNVDGAELIGLSAGVWRANEAADVVRAMRLTFRKAVAPADVPAMQATIGTAQVQRVVALQPAKDSRFGFPAAMAQVAPPCSIYLPTPATPDTQAVLLMEFTLLVRDEVEDERGLWRILRRGFGEAWHLLVQFSWLEQGMDCPAGEA